MLLKTLKKYFGYDSFRSGQSELIDGILNGRDVLGIMPTGGGKSICFQVPALMMKGITLVVSPLISLMQDQVKGLLEAGISCAYINSTLSPKQIDTALGYARTGKYKIIYVAPERLLTDSFLGFAKDADISMLVVDEAHCISQWGQDFRPSYAQIPQFISRLERRPVISAFTATATKQVREDILKLLQLSSPFVLLNSFDRSNLYYEVKKTSDKMTDLLAFLHSKKDSSGIIYCSTRKTVEEVCEKLCKARYSANKYHAGLSPLERKENQEAFVLDEVKIMVATNAFGMGIDKANVNFVVHYNMPKDMESYYQEAGRAGRDGTPAHCLVLYSGQDVVINQFIIQKGRDTVVEDKEIEKELMEREYKRLKEMTFYCTTNECLRHYILQYFGEVSKPTCQNCANCDTEFEMVDMTVEAQKIISCIIKTNQSFGKTMIMDILRGAKNKKLLQFGFDKLSTYNISQKSTQELRRLIDTLVFSEYLTQTDSQYPILKLTNKAKNILNKTDTIKMKWKKEIEKVAKRKNDRQLSLPEGRQDLFLQLRELRSKLAKAKKLPAFYIFGDLTLIDMCQKLPLNEETFINILGVGQQKLATYGKEFIELIVAHCNEHNLTPPQAEHNNIEIPLKKMVLLLPNEEMIKEVPILDEMIPVSKINEHLNIMLDHHKCSKISAIKINKWLESIGYITTESTQRGNRKYPTQKGLDAGIVVEKRSSRQGIYEINLFPKSLQLFIAENIREILEKF